MVAKWFNSLYTNSSMDPVQTRNFCQDWGREIEEPNSKKGFGTIVHRAGAANDSKRYKLN